MQERWFEADADYWAGAVDKPGRTTPAADATQAATVGAMGGKQCSEITHGDKCTQVCQNAPARPE